ncbi:hypothetical protein R1flu_016790 [Riccia fluitans]|uniref:Uncharacterized protein n=1 Tax=Riccia fluitans TaxID=41844 RepID=A0ABD1YMU9_9MARC
MVKILKTGLAPEFGQSHSCEFSEREWFGDEDYGACAGHSKERTEPAAESGEILRFMVTDPEQEDYASWASYQLTTKSSPHQLPWPKVKKREAKIPRTHSGGTQHSLNPCLRPQFHAQDEFTDQYNCK